MHEFPRDLSRLKEPRFCKSARSGDAPARRLVLTERPGQPPRRMRDYLSGRHADRLVEGRPVPSHRPFTDTRSNRLRVRPATVEGPPRRPPPMNDVTRILSAIEQGDPQAAEQLLPLVYDELRKLAAQRLAQEKPGQTLQATALVHEAYLRLVGRRGQARRLERPRPLLRRRRRGDAPHPRRQRPPQATPPSTAATGGGSTLDAVDLAGRGPRRRPARPRRGADRARRARTRSRPSWSSSATSPACRSRRPPRAWASPRSPPTGTGPSPAPGSTPPWPTTRRRARGE